MNETTITYRGTKYTHRNLWRLIDAIAADGWGIELRRLAEGWTARAQIGPVSTDIGHCTASTPMEAIAAIMPHIRHFSSEAVL